MEATMTLREKLVADLEGYRKELRNKEIEYRRLEGVIAALEGTISLIDEGEGAGEDAR